jgi:hypothetical protein
MPLIVGKDALVCYARTRIAAVRSSLFDIRS